MGADIEGKIAVVTGASRGIGREIARQLARRRRMKVAAVARSLPELDELVSEIEKEGVEAMSLRADVTCEDEVVSLFDQIHEEWGAPDVLVNNAGLGLYGPLAEFSCEDFDRMTAVNLRGTFLCAREAMRKMIPEKRGYIINISSVVGFKGYANQAGYTATKHGVVGMTKALAKEAQEHGIRVSVINPGGVDTEMVRKSRPDLDTSVLLKPSDVAQSVLFLLKLSDRAAVDEIYLRRNAGTPF